MFGKLIILLVCFFGLGTPLELLDFGEAFLSVNETSNNFTELNLQTPIVYYGASFTSIFVSTMKL